MVYQNTELRIALQIYPFRLAVVQPYEVRYVDIYGSLAIVKCLACGFDQIGALVDFD